MKPISNKLFLLAYNESFYSFKNDITLIKASLIIEYDTFDLRLNFTKYHISDTEPQTKTYLPSYNVGTFLKPKKRLINSLLKDYQIRNRPFNNNGWIINDNLKNLNLMNLFIELKKDVLIMRAIKLIRIKRALNKKRK